MGMDLSNSDVLKESRYGLSSRFEFLKLDDESLENCEDFDEDYLEYLKNILDRTVEESGKDKDLSNDELNGHDRCLENILDNSVKEAEKDKELSDDALNDHDQYLHDILDKSVKEPEKDKVLSDDALNDHDQYLHDILDKSVKESEKDQDLSDNDLNGHDQYLHDILDKPFKELVKDQDLSDNDLNGHDHFVNSVGKSEESDDDDPQYKFFLSHVKCHGNSFTYEFKEENGLSKTIEYHKEEPIDGGGDLKINRNMSHAVERKRKRSKSEPKNSKNVKKSSLRSFSHKKSSTPSRKHTSRKQRVSPLQPKSDKDGLGKIGEEQREKSRIVVSQVIKTEQDPLVAEDYQDFLNSAEIVSGRINLPLKSDKTNVYDRQVDLADDLCHEVKSMRPRSPGKNNVEEDDSCQILDIGHMTDHLKEKVMADLRKPFDEEEYNSLWHVFTRKNHNERHKELRNGREKSFTTDNKAKSYLEQHKDVRRELEAVPDDKRKRLNILRGFFFWLKNVAWGAFKPWKDASCLAVMPGSH